MGAFSSYLASFSNESPNSIASSLVYALPYGGPVSMVWGWLAASTLIMFVGLALAELASAAPTSGGLYFWTWTFSPPQYKKVLAWLVGCKFGILFRVFAYINRLLGLLQMRIRSAPSHVLLRLIGAARSKSQPLQLSVRVEIMLRQQVG